MLILLVKFINFRGDPMLSFLEIDKSNVTDVSKDKNKIPTQEDLQEEVTFSKIFDDLIEDKEAVKKKGKNLEKKAINLLLKEKNIADVDKEEIKEEPIIETKEGSIAFKKEHKKIIKTTKETLEIAIEDKPTKKAHSLETLRSIPQNAKELLQMAKETKSPKTLKDILQKANNLNLVVKKIHFQGDTQKPNKTILQEIPQKSQSKVTGLKDKKAYIPNEVLSNILQDKKILENGKKIEKNLSLKKEKDKFIQEVKEDFQVIKENPKGLKNTHQEKTISTLTQKREKKDFKDSQIPSSPKEVINAILLQDKKILENGKKIEKNLSLKKEKDKFIQEVKEDFQVIKENPKGLKNTHQEKTISTLTQKREKKDFKDSQILSSPKEVINVIPKDSNIILEQSSKTAIKQTKENLSKQEKPKISFKEEKNPYSSVKKENKIMDKSYEKHHFALQEERQNIQNITKEEIQVKEHSQQSFLDNLLKMQNSAKSSFVSETKEASPIQKEIKEKNYQEVYQGAIQSQNIERFSIQNTFIHFSDKLKEALQNYRPPVTKISLELNPQNLGSVELTITKRGDNIHIQIGSNQQALQLFMQNAQDFKNQLSNLGFNEVQMDFKDTAGNSLGGGFSDSSRGNSQQNFHQNSQNHQKRNENSLYVYQQVDDSYREISHMDLRFSYDA